MNSKIVILIIFVFLFLSWNFKTGVAESTVEKTINYRSFGYWSMFRGNPQHNGRNDDDTLPNAGKFLWKYEMPASLCGVAIDSGGNIYYYFSDSSNQPTLLSLDYNGTERWNITLTTGTLTPNSGPVIGINDTIYVTTYVVPLPLSNYTGGDYLYAISKEGKILWRFNFKGEGPSSAPVIDENGVIYVNVHTKQGSTYAIYPNGTLKWKRNIGALPSRDPAISPDGYIYVYSWHNGSSLYVLNPNGSVRWVYSYGKSVWGSTPAVDDDGTVYIKFVKWLAITPHGTLKWQINFSDITMPAISIGGVVYLTHYEESEGKGYLYAIEKDNGKILWRFGVNGKEMSYPVIGGSGTIYLCLNETLYALSPKGKVLWDKNMGTEKCKFIIIGKNETIYYGGGNYIYALGGHLDIHNERKENNEISDLLWYYVVLGIGIVASASVIYYIKEDKK